MYIAHWGMSSEATAVATLLATVQSVVDFEGAGCNNNGVGTHD